MKNITIKVPQLGESVTEARIAKIYKSVSSKVETDEVLFELETDKVTLEVSVPTKGIVRKIFVKKDDMVQSDHSLVEIEPEDTVDQVTQNTEQSSCLQETSSYSQQNITQASSMQTKTDEPKLTEENDTLLNHKRDAPAAERIITEYYLHKDAIQGSGKQGRITKADAIEYLTELQKNKQESIQEDKRGNQQEYEQVDKQQNKRETRIRMSRLRQRIAERLKEAQNTAAILTTFNEIDMSSVISFRNKYKDAYKEKYAVKLGFMSFFVKACIAALRIIPVINSEINGEEIVYKNYYDIGVAVNTEKGLVVPVIRNADKLSFVELEISIAHFAQKARTNNLAIADLTGGTFTISNGGIYGSLLSTPIINPPQAGILGMHTIQKRPVARGDCIEIRPMMYVALSYDHRIVDGSGAVSFLKHIKEILEDPIRLLLDI